MQQVNSQNTENIRYQVDEHPPTPLTIGLGIQLATLCVAGVVLGPAIVVNAAGGDQTYLLWAVFGAIFVSSISSVIQAVRFGRIGAVYVLVMGTSGAFIAVSVAAIAQGGPAMLAILVIVSSLFQFLLGWHLSLFRRILTPAVAGTVIMLIPVTVMPIIFSMLSQVPEGAPANSAPITALVTALAIGAIALKAKGMLRLWAPVIGIVVGSLVAIYYGIYDFSTLKSSAWFGLPKGGWPGFDLSFGPVFWSLLPAFVFVTLVGAIETVGDGVAIQRVSWRRARATDFRAVQGAVNADGLGNFLSGLIGTVPNTTYSTSVSVTALTGVAARGIGVALGATFIVLAFFPKILAVIIAIPGPVAAAYMTVLLGLLFVVGMRVVIQDGADYKQSLIVGIAFWVGVGFQNGLIFPEITRDFAGGILENGMTAGGLTAIILSLFVEFTNPRRHRLSVPFDT
ncbi:MAG: xanthine/uracil/vitamin C permease, partial [Gammaproteobacteria bacterium]|nr:xanthine/uracil/vitamin C permease [Gammaproteobacteria bacterium]